MIKEALRARTPLITVTTLDPLSVEPIVHHYTGRSSKTLTQARGSMPEEGDIYITHRKIQRQSGWLSEGLYTSMLNAGSTCIVVNPVEPIDMAYDAGELETPADVAVLELKRFGYDLDAARSMYPAVAGLSLLEIRWVMSFAQSSGKKMTKDFVRRVRARIHPPAAGLQSISGLSGFYMKNSEIEDWLVWNRDFLTHDDARLRPRGLLLSGPPGTGKTMGAKHIANDFGVPLFRLEMGVIKRKYVGESEQRLRSALSSADSMAPCVVLFDEVEKLFKQQSDAGTSQSLLAEMLWWMQEHESAVLTIMTTNDADSIPPELVRAGRVDEHFVLPKITDPKHIDLFLRCGFSEFGIKFGEEPLGIEVEDDGVSYADLWGLVIQRAKIEKRKVSDRITVKKEQQ
jgi:hypothetical protein